MTDANTPSGADPNRSNSTTPWHTDQPGSQDPTMRAPTGWSPSGGPPPVPPSGPPSGPMPGPSGGPPPVPPGGPPLSSSTPPGWPVPPAYGPAGWAPGPPGWAPGPPGPPGPPPRRTVPTWLIVAGVIVALLVVVGLALTAVTVMGSDSEQTDTADASATETTTSSPEATIPVADLKGLLPSVSKVQSVLHLSGLDVVDDWSDAYVLRPEDRVSEVSCVGVQYVSEGTVYSGSGYTAMRGQRMRKDGAIVDANVASFPNAADAAGFVDKSTQTWQNCAGKPLTRYFSASDESESWMIGTPETSDDSVRILNYEEGGEGWACSHALGNKTNVIVETLVCGNAVSDDAGRLLDEMLSSMAA